jgi:hypothetical protein
MDPSVAVCSLQGTYDCLVASSMTVTHVFHLMQILVIVDGVFSLVRVKEHSRRSTTLGFPCPATSAPFYRAIKLAQSFFAL